MFNHLYPPVNMSKTRSTFFLIVQWATICVFFGRAYQHLFWDAPFRSLLWSEEWMSWLVEGVLNTPWSEYVRSPQTDTNVQSFIAVHGVLYLLAALVALFIKRVPRLLHYLLLLGAGGLALLAFMYMKEKFFHFGQFFEYSLQVGSPLFLFYLVRKPHLPNKRFIFIVKCAIAITFVCHGLYAINYYPRPGNFTQMTMSILNISEPTAYQFLTIAGVMDFIVAIGIFLPKRWAAPFLLYTIVWGFGTSIARVWANFYPDFFVEVLHQWSWETIMRFPHFLIPFAVWWWERNE